MSLCPLPRLSGAGPTACHIAEKEPGHSEQAASPVRQFCGNSLKRVMDDLASF